MDKVSLLVLALIWPFIGFLWWVDVRKNVKARSWPTVYGTLTKSDFIQTSDEDATYRDRIKIEYEYCVKGKIYKSSKIAHGLWAGSNDSDFKIFRSIVSGGKSVLVYYNPVKPSEAYLIVGWQGYHWSFVVLTASAIYGLVEAVRSHI